MYLYGISAQNFYFIFFRTAVKTQFYSVPEALKMHRELQDPAIYNTPNAPLRLRLELNMGTERQACCTLLKQTRAFRLRWFRIRTKLFQYHFRSHIAKNDLYWHL